MSDLRLLLLGPPRIEQDGGPLEIRRRKAIALCAYLAVTGEPHRRESLASACKGWGGFFWHVISSKP